MLLPNNFKPGKPIKLQKVMVEIGPPGYSGKVGYLNPNTNQVFMGPMLKPDEFEVGPTTAFETFRPKVLLTTRPLTDDEKEAHAKPARKQYQGSRDGLDQFRT